MEDYVVPDFYDVLVGVDVTGSDNEEGNEIHTTGSFKWNNTSGISDSGPTITVPAGMAFQNEEFTFTITSNDTTESVMAKITALPEAQQYALSGYSSIILHCGA